jgi:hypothetical protein
MLKSVVFLLACVACATALQFTAQNSLTNGFHTRRNRLVTTEYVPNAGMILARNARPSDPESVRIQNVAPTSFDNGFWYGETYQVAHPFNSYPQLWLNEIQYSLIPMTDIEAWIYKHGYYTDRVFDIWWFGTNAHSSSQPMQRFLNSGESFGAR